MHRFRSLFGVVVAIFACALLTTQAFAIELTSDVTIKQGNYRSSISISGNCTRYSQYFVLNQNADVVCGIGALSLSTPDRNDYAVGDFITQTIYLNNSARNDSGDFWGRFNEYSVSTSGSANADLVDIKFEQLSSSSSKITFISRVWSAGNIYQLSYGFPNAALNLWPSEELTTGMTTVWSEKNTNVDYSVTLGNINSFLSSINSHISSIDDHVLWNNQELLQIKLNTGTISGNVSDIKQLISGNTSAINDQTQKMQDIHDDEKQTIEDNGEEAQGNFNDFKPTLSFSDPFSWMWSLGTSEDCANIPTLASLLHSSSSTYCSWWPSSIRSIVSPIVNIFVLIIIFGFAIRWLKKGGM